MLRGIKNASSGWFGKIVMASIMGLLTISFAIWGIGDIFRGFGLSTVAKIGGSEISLEQFRQYYNDRLQQLGRRVGRPVTPDQARSLGLERQIIGQLVAETTLDEHARRLRLRVSDAEIARRITLDPTFHSPSGQFDRLRFEQIIRQAGFSEARFVDEQRRVIIRRELADTVSAGLRPPAAMLAAVNRFQNEERSIEFIELGPAQAGAIAKPTPEVLGKYFEERKALFRAPEYRKLVLVVLTAAEQARWSTVSDADARREYEEHKSAYGSPESRHVLQMAFPNVEAARTAAEKIAKGTSFAALATERGLKATDIDLGTVVKSAIIDPAVAEVAFALKEGEVSAPVQGRFGVMLVQVAKIEPAKQPSYEQVAAQIKTEIAGSRAKAEVLSLHDKIEDERAGGASLAEVAKKLGLSSHTIEAIDRSGRTPDGAQVANLPAGVDVLSAAFASDVGVDNDPLQVPGGGYLWFDVVGVTPSRERNLDEIAPQVEQRWRDDEIAAKLKTRADDMLGKLKSATALAQLAAEAGVKLETANALKRGKSTDKVPPKVLEAIFRTAKDAAGSAEGGRQSERVVFRITDITDPKLDAASPAAKQLTDALRQSYSDDAISEYVAWLENDLGVSLNDSAIKQVVGGGSGGDIN